MITATSGAARRPLLVVAIGSSAGGLEALTAMLASLPVGPAVAYVVAQHLSPDHDSSLVQLLGRATKLRVRTGADGTALTAGEILVAPPGNDVRVVDGRLSVLEPGEGPGPNPSIDVLMSSVAAYGSRAAGVVLSGTGADGSVGVRELHRVGAVTIAQRPDTARFGAMPLAAIATGAVDLVLAPEQVGAAIERIAAAAPAPVVGPPVEGDGEERTERAPTRDDTLEVASIVTSLAAVTGVDFSQYKTTTLMRQSRRRQALTGTADLAGYRELVAADPEEARSLARSLQVGVTSFFRDPDVWTALAGHLPGVLRPGHQFRVWVPGCSTGEEAYTLAMTIAGVLGARADLPLRLKVFATDLNESSLEVARRGRYGDEAVAAVPPALREAWMQRTGGHWDVAPAVRESVVFARHDIAQDAPFPQVDLVSLRNMLIYFQPPLQQRVLGLCHFALVTGGLLVLGGSERPGVRAGLFEPVDDQHRIYARQPGPAAQAWVLPRPVVPEPGAAEVVGGPADLGGQLRAALVAAYAPPGLVVDADDEVVEVLGDVSPWCRIGPGRLAHRAISLLRDELRPTARQLLVQARHAGDDGVVRDVVGADPPVRLTARWVGAPDSGWRVLTFSAVPPHTAETSGPGADTGAAQGEVERVTRQLEISENALQATIEELGASNEELRALNEELQASSEEVQASTEEVQASNEELEATNEELTTLNSELQVRGDDLVVANRELENVQQSLTSGLVIVDRDLVITRFTQLAVRLFPLIDSDLGRPLIAMPTTVPVPDLEGSLRSCVSQGTSATREVSGANQTFLLQFAPYLLADRSIDGVVVTISDVTELSAAKREVRRTLAHLTEITNALRETVWQRDSSGALLFVNDAVERVYGLSRARVLADPSVLEAAIHPDDRDRVAAAAREAVGRRELRYRIVRPDGETRWVEESALEVPASDLHGGYVVGSVLDVTDRVAATALAEQARHHAAGQAALFDATLDTAYLGVVILDSENRVLRTNAVFAELSGAPAEVLVGTPLGSIVPDFDTPDGADVPTSMWSEAGVVHRRLRARDGRQAWVAIGTRPVAGDEEQAAARVVTVHDLTRLRDEAGALSAQARFDQQTGTLTRAHFRDRLADELARADRADRAVGVLWLDLDGFKDVNDRYGHRAGDAVLHEVASRLVQSARRQDSVGRLGGDEFAMIVTEFDDPDSLEIVAARVLAALRTPITSPDGVLHVSGSVGIAIGPGDGADADALMHSADTAMYAAKAAGRDALAYFRPTMNRSAELRATRRHEISEAVRAGAFVMAYQPVVDLRSDQVAMAEALVRWQRGSELVTAGDFMDVIQDTGHLRALGRLVLALVDRDLATLDAHLDRSLPVAINMSPEELDERDLVNRVLDWHPPGGFERIVIEVTESTVMANQGRAMEGLVLMRRLGATIAIDDFGVGFSNLSMLERLQPSIIKIDRSLLVSATDDTRSQSILAAAVGLGHALEARVVVEGIETQHQSDLVTSLGADFGQGYFFARPMPLDELGATLGRATSV